MTDKVTKNLDDHHFAMKQIQDIVWELQSISRAFATTGNTNMASTLDMLAGDLDQANEQARNAFSGEITGRFQDNMRASENIVASALAASCMHQGQTELGEFFAKQVTRED